VRFRAPAGFGNKKRSAGKLSEVLIYIYTLLTFAMGISALWKGAAYPGIAGIVGPTLCVGSRFWPERFAYGWNLPSKARGIGCGSRLVAVGSGIVYHSGYWIGLFGYDPPTLGIGTDVLHDYADLVGGEGRAQKSR